MDGIDAGDAAGTSVSGAGDVNGDGHPDFMIGAPGADSVGNARPDAGECYVVFGPSVAIDPPTLPHGVEGAPYSVTLGASGGVPPYSWSVSGALPAGIVLDPVSGVLSGVPVAQGSYPVKVVATDSQGCAFEGAFLRSRSYTLVIEPASDIVAGEGSGPGNPNRLRVFDRAGFATSVDLFAYGAGTMGTNVASGRIDLATYASILSGPGPGPTLGPHVRAFDRAGAPMAKVSFYAYGTLRYGSLVATGKLDADACEEIVTGAGAGSVFGPHVRGFDFDGVALAAIAKVSYFAYGTLKWGVDVAAGDVDGDAMGEILTEPGPGSTFACQTRGWNYDGIQLSSIGRVSFVPFPTTYGGKVAAGDVDGDGYAEIIVTPGAGPANPQSYLGFDYDGSAIAPLPGFSVTPSAFLYGGRVAAGDASGDLRADLVTSSGPDPAAPAWMAVYEYNGSLSPGTTFTAYASTFGAQVAAGELGYF
ncbi:MAG: putative Ig domain-containing protein [Acidobacteriota bacterium]